MIIILVTLLLFKYCETSHDASSVVFEPIFFEMRPDYLRNSADFSVKGRNRGIPMLLPDRRRTSKLQHGLYFPTERPQGESLPVESNSVANNFVIGFSTHPPINTKFSSTLFDLNCHIKDSTVYYNGECTRLLSPWACDPVNLQYWLVLDEFGVPNCVRKPCPLKEVWYKNQCVDVEGDSVCGEGEIIYLEFTGEAQCDCEVNFIYDRRLKKCISEHRQGSCPRGSFLEINDRQKVTCVTNPCLSDSMVLNEDNNKCYTKNFEGICNATNSLALMFNDDDHTASCINGIATKNIFEVPALTSCPPGSRRGYLGSCQRSLRIAKNPFSYRVPTMHKSRYSTCHKGYTRYPDGSCGRINSVLG